MPQNALEAAIAAHRRQLLQLDADALARILAQYQSIEERLRPAIELLVQSLDTGEALTPTQLFRLQRYQELQRQLEGEMQRLAAMVQSVTTDGQDHAIRLAIQHAQDTARFAALSTAGEAVVASNWVRVPTRAIEDFLGAARSGPLADLLAGFGDVASNVMVKEITAGMAAGTSPRVVADAIVKATDLARNRALTITRTEMLRAYRGASTESFRVNGDILDGWTWAAAQDAGTCAACLGMDGSFHELDEDMDSHPNCFPAGTLVSGPVALAATTRWYTGELVQIVTSHGHQISVTPNHPILTPQGWIAAGLIREGGDVICGDPAQRMIPVHPDDENTPTLIEDVAESLRTSPGMSVVTVPAAAEYLHGDGLGGDIDVVRADSFLYMRGDADFCQPHSEQLLGRRNMILPDLVGYGPLTKGFPSVDLTPASALSGLGVSSSFGGRATALLDSVGFANGPQWNIETTQPAGDGCSTYAIGSGEAGHTLPSEIAGSDLLIGKLNVAVVVSATRVVFAGLVYNLETSEGWYSANGIITHNCRCTQIPHLKDEPMHSYTDGATWLSRQSDDVQDRVLGLSGGEAYRAGDVKLSDFVRAQDTAQWGATISNGGVAWAKMNAERRSRRAA